MELPVVPRDGSQGWFCPHGDTLTLLISTGALLALQSPQEEGGDVFHCSHKAGEELLPALHQLCCLHGDGHLWHLEQAPAQGCDGSCKTPTSAHCAVSTALALHLSPRLMWLRDRGVNRALGERCARQGQCLNRETKARMWHQQ